ncbi:MAG: ABC transporter permease subunit [Planctomycetaceae bacterium]
MTGFGAAFRAEASDVARSLLFWLGVAATASAAWLFGRPGAGSTNGWLLFQAGARGGAQAAGFFLLGLSAVSVASERTRGTVRWILPRPIGRAGFVLGKAAALATAAAALLAVCLLVAWLVARGSGFRDVVVQTGFDFGDAMPVDPEFSAAVLSRRAMGAALLLLPALLMATGLGLLVSCLARSSASAVIVALAVAIPLLFLPEIVGLSRETARLLPFRAADEFLTRLADFARALSGEPWPRYGAGPLAAAIACAAGLPILGSLLFRRLDLTD